MKSDVAKPLWRFAGFTSVCVLGIFALLAIFAQLRFEKDSEYHALFTNVTGLKNGDFVRIAGVEVGKVKQIALLSDATVRVAFGADTSVVLTEGTRAVVRYNNLIGDRYLELAEGVGRGEVLRPGATIPLDHTEPALDLDALIGGFRPLFRALNPDQVNALSEQLISALQGQGATIGSFLAQTASVTSTLADRDELIGEVISNLNNVLGSIGDQGERFDKAVTALSELVDGLASRKTDISAGLAYINKAAAEFSDLLAEGRPPFKSLIAENDRASGIVVADHDYFDNLLNTLPDKYRVLSRQGLYGDYFGFYLCDVVLKVNGRGGQPVYVKVAGQDTGRCAPK